MLHTGGIRQTLDIRLEYMRAGGSPDRKGKPMAVSYHGCLALKPGQRRGDTVRHVDKQGMPRKPRDGLRQHALRQFDFASRHGIWFATERFDGDRPLTILSDTKKERECVIGSYTEMDGQCRACGRTVGQQPLEEMRCLGVSVWDLPRRKRKG